MILYDTQFVFGWQDYGNDNDVVAIIKNQEKLNTSITITHTKWIGLLV